MIDAYDAGHDLASQYVRWAPVEPCVSLGRTPKRSGRGCAERKKDDARIDGVRVLPLLPQDLPIFGTRGPIGGGGVGRLGPENEDDEIGGDQSRRGERQPKRRSVKVPEGEGEAEIGKKCCRQRKT